MCGQTLDGDLDGRSALAAKLAVAIGRLGDNSPIRLNTRLAESIAAAMFRFFVDDAGNAQRLFELFARTLGSNRCAKTRDKAAFLVDDATAAHDIILDFSVVRIRHIQNGDSIVMAVNNQTMFLFQITVCTKRDHDVEATFATCWHDLDQKTVVLCDFF